MASWMAPPNLLSATPNTNFLAFFPLGRLASKNTLRSSWRMPAIVCSCMHACVCSINHLFQDSHQMHKCCFQWLLWFNGNTRFFSDCMKSWESWTHTEYRASRGPGNLIQFPLSSPPGCHTVQVPFYIVIMWLHMQLNNPVQNSAVQNMLTALLSRGIYSPQMGSGWSLASSLLTILFQTPLNFSTRWKQMNNKTHHHIHTMSPLRNWTISIHA